MCEPSGWVIVQEQKAHFICCRESSSCESCPHSRVVCTFCYQVIVLKRNIPVMELLYFKQVIRNCLECNRIVIDDSLQGVTSSGIFAWSGSLDQRIYLEKGQVFLRHFLAASFWSLRQCYGYVEVQRTHWFLLAEVPTERKNQIRNLFIYCTKIAHIYTHIYM